MSDSAGTPGARSDANQFGGFHVQTGPLTDADRWPWLGALAAVAEAALAGDGGLVLACSALARRYRGRLGLPEPDHQVLLDVPVELAAQRARQRADTEADRARDAYERDAGLQQRTAAVYRALAQGHWHGRWSAVAPDIDPAALAADVSA